MPDISALATLINSFSAAQNIVKGFLDLKTLAEVQSKVIELQSVIMSAQTTALAAQTERAALLRSIDVLNEQLANLRHWEEEKLKYKLTAVDAGVYVYELRTDANSTEPAHWLCANCFAQDQKSILQYIGDFYGISKHECQRCKCEVKVHTGKQPTPIPYSNQGIV